MDYAAIALLLEETTCKNRKLPFQRALYIALKTGISQGMFRPNARLPATRELAQTLAVARNSVLYAYEQLIVEGYLLSSRQGTRVARIARAQSGDAHSLDNPTGIDGTDGPGLSARGRNVPPYWRPHVDVAQPFMPGIPDIAKFPFTRWRALMERTYRDMHPGRLGVGETGGEPELREAIAAYVSVARGVPCCAEQVIVTHGAQGALDLCARMLADEGQTAWIENPGYFGARVALQTAGLRLHPVAVDAQGANPTDEDWQRYPPRVIYLTPAHQYPLGSVLTAARRFDILQRALQARAWIIEDDYDSEFRYRGDPVPALSGLMPGAPVVYVGTFSKTLLPMLRLGYLIVPRVLARPLADIASRFARPGHAVEQVTLARFIESGKYSAHIRNMKKLYDEKQRALRQAIKHYMGSRVTLSGGEAGIHLSALFNDPVDDVALHERAKRAGLVIAPLSHYYLDGFHGARQTGMLLGYGAVSASAVAAAVKRVAGLIAS